MSKVDAIKFRMYNTGSVGDCHLLLFEKAGQVTFKMMIDCGGWSTNSELISPVVEDIKTTCGGVIDLLIVTHQHLDHVSGFNQAKPVFDQITVKNVWMSWIENQADDIAKILKTKYGKTLAHIKENADRAVKELDIDSKTLPSIRGLGARMNAKRMKMQDTQKLIRFEMGFEAGKTIRKGARPTNDMAMEYVRAKGEIEYRTPGEVIKGIPGTEGIKFFILGPPRDEDMKYFKIPTDDEEMYKNAMKAAADKSARKKKKESILDTGVQLEENVSPFTSQYYVSDGEKRKFNQRYNSEEYVWRQIETDWLETAASIAMRATRLTNNTSLAMALEFEDSGRVVLLPGDAQSGNWMGWHKTDVSESLRINGGKTTEQLLNNTVFYKVGHHGSHNGTASRSGFDHVNGPDVVAMMPLAQDEVPEEWGGAENFPAKGLYGVLITKTRGRLIRTDEGVVTDPRLRRKETN